MAQSFNASLNVSLNTASLNASTKQVKQALGRITGQASEFQKSLDASTARVFAFGATTAVLNGVTQSFKKLISTTIEVEKRLIEVNSIFQATETSFNRFRNSIFQVAKETGQSFATVADGAAELARQGLNAEETASRLKSALVLTRISGLDAEKSVKALTAAINGFESAGLKHTEIVNKMVAVDTAFAVSAQDLAEAFSRAGSTAEDAGVSFDELLALVTAVEQKTARGGAVIGNAFKSIFTRLARGTTIEELKELGVQIDATQTGVQKLNALSNAIEGISDPTVVSKIKELAGGVFQINVVSAALKDLSSETGIFRDAATTAATATNEAFEKNKALGESLASNINALVVGLTSLAEKVGSLTFGPVLESLVGIATKFTEFLDNALDPEKGNTFIKGFFKAIGTFLSGPAIVIFTTAFVKITKLVARFAGEGLKTLFQMGTQTERVKQIEGGIVQLLQKDDMLRKQMANTTLTQAQREQAVIQAIKRENALLSQQAQLMRSLANAAAARGVRGFSDTGGFGGRGGRRFNAGFRAEEAEAMMLGASQSVKAHMGKGTIGGQRFIMNNQEDEIRNFAGGRDSAVIPRYPRGFVPNYLDIDTVNNRPRSQFFDADGNPKTDKVRNAIANPNSRLGAALIAKRDSAAGKKTYYANNKPNKAVMIIPEEMGFASNKADHKFATPYGRKQIDFFEGGMAGISPNLKGNKKFGHLLDIKETIEDNLAAAVNESLNLLVSKTGVKTKPKSYKGGEVTKILEKGGAGAFGAIKGAIFEGVIQAITGGVAQDKGQLDIQFDKARKDLELIFGLQDMNFEFGDFKSSDSIGNKTKYVKQIIDNVAGRIEIGKGKTKVKNEKRRARGFIPNFTRRGGVPMSLMRVHKDDQGEPVAVTNLRDEPNGLQDAIKRERNGVGMFAGGFVPNYNVAKAGPALLRFTKGLFKAENRMTTLGIAFMGLTSAAGTVTAKMEQQHALLDSMNESSKELMNTQEAIAEKGVLAVSDELMARDELTQSLKEQRTVLQGSSEMLMRLAGVGSTVAMLLAFRGQGAGDVSGRGSGGGFFGRRTPSIAPSKIGGVRTVGGSFAAASKDPKLKAAMLNQNKGGMGTGTKFGIAGTVAGIALTASEISNIEKRQDISRQDKRYQKGRALGGGIGATLGGIGASALTGMALGSFAPGIGNLAGGAIGLGAGILGAFGVGKAGQAIGGAAAGGAGDGSNPIDLLNQRIDSFLPSELAEMGFGEDFKKATNKFNERLVKTGNATPEFVTELTNARQEMARFASAVALEESKLEDGESTIELNQAQRDLSMAQRKVKNILLKGAQLSEGQLLKDKEGIEKAELEFARASLEAQKQIVAAQRELAAISQKAVEVAEENLREASIRNILADAITGPMKGASKLSAQQDLTIAGVDSTRAKFGLAQSNLATKEGNFFGSVDNKNLIPDVVREIAGMIEGGQAGELTDEARAQGDAYLAAVGEERAKVKSSGIAFETAVKTAMAGFQVKMTEIEEMKAENAKKIEETLAKSISSAADTIKNIFGGEALDMDFMGQQVGDIVSEINKGEKMDKEALGQMISEFDDQGLGVKVEDLIRQFDPSITAKELRGVLTDVVKVGLGGAETAAGKKLTGAMMPDYLRDKGIDTTDLDTKLREEAKAIEQKLATTKKNIENLLNDEEAGEFAQSVIDAKNAMQQLATNAEESIKPIRMDVQKTETIAGLISTNNQTILDAEEAIKTAQGLIRDAQAELDRAKGK